MMTYLRFPILLLLVSCTTSAPLVPVDPDRIEYKLKPGSITADQLVSKLKENGYREDSAKSTAQMIVFQPHAYQVDRGSAVHPLPATASVTAMYSADKLQLSISHRCLYEKKYASEVVDPAGTPCHSDDASFQAAKAVETNHIRAVIRRMPGVEIEDYVHGAPAGTNNQGNHVDPNTTAVGFK